MNPGVLFTGTVAALAHIALIALTLRSERILRIGYARRTVRAAQDKARRIAGL